jgi:tetratricopeptide (TPR) repeat protein
MLDSPITRTINSLTIDFLPVSEIRGMRVRDVDEDTVVAMYLKNRAAEMLAEGRVDDAYWWTREAVRRAPRFAAAHITLAVLYARRDELDLASRVLDRVLELEPNNTQALANLGRLYERQGRTEQASTVRERLARLEPQPPFHYFDLGMAAMARKDYVAAKALFAKEVDRADYNPEFHFWLARANYQLGEVAEAREHLMRAIRASSARNDRDLYAAKLAWLREHGVR